MTACRFGELKWLRRVATRHEKLALHYLGMLHNAIIDGVIASGFAIHGLEDDDTPAAAHAPPG